MKRIFIFPVLITLIFIHCGQNPLSSDKNVSYTPLAVGDITQLISVQDGQTILLTVTGTIQRTDHKTVYRQIWQYGKSSFDTFYYYVGNGYYMATELDSVKDDTLLLSINPFHEQRLAKSHPKEYDTFIQTPGYTESDTWITHALDSIQVPAGTFNNVFAFTLDGFLTTVYGQDVGWLGTSISSSPAALLDFACTYKKISGKEYGWLQPAADAVLDKITVNQKGRLIDQLNRVVFVNGKPYLIDGSKY